MVSEETYRWRGAVSMSLFAVAVGAVSRVPGVLLLGVFGAAVAGYAKLFTAPDR
jgi:hypothetical protein